MCTFSNSPHSPFRLLFGAHEATAIRRATVAHLVLSKRVEVVVIAAHNTHGVSDGGVIHKVHTNPGFLETKAQFLMYKVSILI